jgi:hypothetical protein
MTSWTWREVLGRVALPRPVIAGFVRGAVYLDVTEAAVMVGLDRARVPGD